LVLSIKTPWIFSVVVLLCACFFVFFLFEY
jgi:hypothetical protein